MRRRNTRTIPRTGLATTPAGHAETARAGAWQGMPVRIQTPTTLPRAQRPPPHGADSRVRNAHAPHPGPHRRPAHRHRPPAARIRAAQHRGLPARQPGRLLGQHPRPHRLDLLPRLLPRHLRRAAADPAHGPHPRLRLLRRHGRELHPAPCGGRGCLVLDGPAGIHRRGPGGLLRRHRELAQRSDRARTPWPGVRHLHGGEPRCAGGCAADAAPGFTTELHPVRDRRGVRLPVAAAGHDDALSTATDRQPPAPESAHDLACGPCRLRRRTLVRPVDGRVLEPDAGVRRAHRPGRGRHRSADDHRDHRRRRAAVADGPLLGLRRPPPGARRRSSRRRGVRHPGRTPRPHRVRDPGRTLPVRRRCIRGLSHRGGPPRRPPAPGRDPGRQYRRAVPARRGRGGRPGHRGRTDGPFRRHRATAAPGPGVRAAGDLRDHPFASHHRRDRRRTRAVHADDAHLAGGARDGHAGRERRERSGPRSS